MSPPVIMNTFTNDGVVMRHREFVGNLTLDADYDGKFKVIKSLNLNPGVKESFPWLAGISENWKEYEWHGVLVEYKPLTALATTSGAGAMGSVMIGTHYDMYEDTFAAVGNDFAKKAMLNSEYTTSSKPQLAQIHPIECKRSQTPVSRKWIRTAGVPAGADKRLYDHCYTEIAVEGVPMPSPAAKVTLGEIWITFEVCLFKPKMVDKLKFTVEQDIETFESFANLEIGDTSAHLWFAPAPVPAGIPISHTATNSSMNGHFFPGGFSFGNPEPYYRFNQDDVEVGDVFRILVLVGVAGGYAATETLNPTELKGLQPFRWFNATTSFWQVPNGLALGTVRSEEYLVQVIDKNPSGTKADGFSGPTFQWNSQLTWSNALAKPSYRLLIHKLGSFGIQEEVDQDTDINLIDVIDP